MRESRLSWLLNILAGVALMMGGIAAAEAITRAVAPGSPYVRIPALVAMLIPALLFAEYRNHGTLSLLTSARLALISLFYLAFLVVGRALGIVDRGSTGMMAMSLWLTYDISRRANLSVTTREGSNP